MRHITGKKIIMLLFAAGVAGTSLQGCYGKMALTRKVYKINGEVENKYIRSLVSWVFIIVPVYGVSALADFILFNTIEFWSGDNPVASGAKEFNYAENGQNFRIKASKTGDNVSYRVDHYRGTQHVDTLCIAWDVKSGKSQAVLAEADKVTAFVAAPEKGGVKVTSSDRMGHGGLESVALYR